MVLGKKTDEFNSDMFKIIKAYVDENYVADVSTDYYQNEIRELEYLRGMRFERHKAMELKQQQQFLYSFSSTIFNEEELKTEGVNTFQEELLKYISERFSKDSDFYKPLGFSRQLFSKIRSNKDYIPTRRTAMLCCIGLKLDIDQTTDLLSRAGIAFMPTEKDELVIKACILHKQYNIEEINDYLERLNLSYLTYKIEDAVDYNDKPKKNRIGSRQLVNQFSLKCPLPVDQKCNETCYNQTIKTFNNKKTKEIIMGERIDGIEELLKQRILGYDLCEVCDNYDEQMVIELYGDIEYDLPSSENPYDIDRVFVTPDEVSIAPNKIKNISYEVVEEQDRVYVTGEIRVEADASASIWAGDFTDPEDIYPQNADTKSLDIDLSFMVYVDENGNFDDMELKII